MASTTVQSMEDVMALLATGERNRSVGCTNMNEHSSRSHMILSIHSCGTNCVTGVKVTFSEAQEPCIQSTEPYIPSNEPIQTCVCKICIYLQIMYIVHTYIYTCVYMHIYG